MVTVTANSAHLTCSLGEYKDPLTKGYEAMKIMSNGDVKLSIELKRTTRVPDNSGMSALPPDHGNFPLYPVADYAKKLPETVAAKGPGCFFPIYQREGMWINFDAKEVFQLRIFSGGVNVVTGKPRVLDSLSDKLAAAALDDEYKQEGVGVATAAQDYIVVGPSSSDSVQGTHQLWLDGFAVSDATIRQFVAMPAGTGHSVEHQITGNDCVGGLQFEISPRLLAQDTIQIFIKVLTGRVIPLYFSTTNGKAVAIHDIKNAVSQKENIPVDNCDLIYGGKKLSNGYTLDDYNVKADSVIHLVMRLRGGAADTPPSTDKTMPIREKARVEMTLGAGGKIKQTVLANPGFHFCDQETIFFNVQLINASTFAKTLDLPAPVTPISAQLYQELGLPFFNIWNERPSVVHAQGALDPVKSVAEVDSAKGDTLEAEKAAQELTFPVVDLDGNGKRGSDGMFVPKTKKAKI